MYLYTASFDPGTVGFVHDSWAKSPLFMDITDITIFCLVKTMTEEFTLLWFHILFILPQNDWFLLFLWCHITSNPFCRGVNGFVVKWATSKSIKSFTSSFSHSSGNFPASIITIFRHPKLQQPAGHRFPQGASHPRDAVRQRSGDSCADFWETWRKS